MKKLATKLLTFFLTFSFGSHLPLWERTNRPSTTTEVLLEIDYPHTVPPDPNRPADHLIEDWELRVGDFALLKKKRYNPESKSEEEYFVIKKGKQSRKLDVIFGGPGVDAQFGYFFISQSEQKRTVHHTRHFSRWLSVDTRSER